MTKKDKTITKPSHDRELLWNVATCRDHPQHVFHFHLNFPFQLHKTLRMTDDRKAVTLNQEEKVFVN